MEALSVDIVAKILLTNGKVNHKYTHIIEYAMVILAVFFVSSYDETSNLHLSNASIDNIRKYEVANLELRNNDFLKYRLTQPTYKLLFSRYLLPTLENINTFLDDLNNSTTANKPSDSESLISEVAVSKKFNIPYIEKNILSLQFLETFKFSDVKISLEGRIYLGVVLVNLVGFSFLSKLN